MSGQLSWCEIISLAGVVDNTDKHEVDPVGGRSEGENIVVVTRASKAGSVRQAGGAVRARAEARSWASGAKRWRPKAGDQA